MFDSECILYVKVAVRMDDVGLSVMSVLCIIGCVFFVYHCVCVLCAAKEKKLTKEEAPRLMEPRFKPLPPTTVCPTTSLLMFKYLLSRACVGDVCSLRLRRTPHYCREWRPANQRCSGIQGYDTGEGRGQGWIIWIQISSS